MNERYYLDPTCFDCRGEPTPVGEGAQVLGRCQWHLFAALRRAMGLPAAAPSPVTQEPREGEWR